MLEESSPAPMDPPWTPPPPGPHPHPILLAEDEGDEEEMFPWLVEDKEDKEESMTLLARDFALQLPRALLLIVPLAKLSTILTGFSLIHWVNNLSNGNNVNNLWHHNWSARQVRDQEDCRSRKCPHLVFLGHHTQSQNPYQWWSYCPTGHQHQGSHKALVWVHTDHHREDVHLRTGGPRVRWQSHWSHYR